MFVGSTLGGLVPALWDQGGLTLASLVGSTIGGIVGIWAGYKLSRRF
jgi:uncharacterized membrane protein YeaQ/YmgE (transglycosylase-associated protein family)